MAKSIHPPKNLVTTLKNKIANVKPLLDPLPASYLTNKLDDHNKNIYATLLSAVILSKGSITDNESRMLTMLLQRLNIEGDISRYFSQIDNLSEQQILEFAKTLDNDEKRLSFIFDCLLASRCHNPLTKEQIEVINEICNWWKISDHEIHLMVFWVSEVLGITNNLSGDRDEIIDSPVASYTEFPEQPLSNIKFKVSIGDFCLKNTKLATGVKQPKHKTGISLGQVMIQRREYELEDKNQEIKLSQTGLITDYGVINKKYIYYYLIPLPDYLSVWQDYFIKLQKES
ncbi:MAGE domain-containing protein [Moraxella sp. PS-22]|uniref:MAGE domain-containing protein n=1 Tax=Moraxella tetraodonis TaxID=2767221 RepID=A0A9X2A2U7_9GAMM|nr:MAGE domain-containing protein [Moraxella tetraodonis]MCG8147152.1 MAGE domain-containing protein [Moraxella tetraodonis]